MDFLILPLIQWKLVPRLNKQTSVDALYWEEQKLGILKCARYNSLTRTWTQVYLNFILLMNDKYIFCDSH